MLKTMYWPVISISQDYATSTFKCPSTCNYPREEVLHWIKLVAQKNLINGELHVHVHHIYILGKVLKSGHFHHCSS